MNKTEKTYIIVGFVWFLMGSIHWMCAIAGVVFVSMAFMMYIGRKL